MKKISLKDVRSALKRDEMRAISGGSGNPQGGGSTIPIGGGGYAPCPSWPGCFSDCDCGVWNCSNPATVRCAYLPCTNSYGGLSTARKCSC